MEEGYKITCPRDPEICIPMWWFADRVNDCPNGDDEKTTYAKWVGECKGAQLKIYKIHLDSTNSFKYISKQCYLSRCIMFPWY